MQAHLIGTKGQPAKAIDNLTVLLSRKDVGPRLRSWALSVYAVFQANIGEHDLALKASTDALREEPALAKTFADLSRTLSRAGRHEEAITRASQAVALDPWYWRNYETLAISLINVDRHEEALEPARMACELSESQSPCSIYAYLLLKAGHLEESKRVAARAESMEETLFGTYNIACYWAYRGDYKRALYHLRRSVELGYASHWIQEDQSFAPLHGNPEFEAIVAEVKKRLAKD
jgi:tetratricopeptide (TPR) repeat protein